MPFGIGPAEIVVVLVIGLLVLGPKRLPGMAKSVGSGVRDFRDAVADHGTDATPELTTPTQVSRTDPHGA